MPRGGTRRPYRPSHSARANKTTSQSTRPQVPRQQPPPPKLQSPPPQQQQQPQPVDPWSKHRLNLLPPSLSTNGPLSGPSPSPFLRYGHALSTTATAAGELFLFGGLAHNSLRNDLYVISTQGLSATLLPTSGQVPSPRSGHAIAYIGNSLLVWGGATNAGDRGLYDGSQDNSLYLLNLASREWTRVWVNGPGPVGRYYHAVTTVGSKLFVFGGKTNGVSMNDMWSFDVNSINSNPGWESYEPAPGDKRPPARDGHVLVAIGDHIILFGGGAGDQSYYNDTWSFDVSTRRWAELQCTGYSPLPRQGHAAAPVGDVMFVFGGRGVDGAYLDELIAFKLSTQHWFMLQTTGPSPSRRWCHTVASEGIRVFVLGGGPSAGAWGDESALIHVLDTTHILPPIPYANAWKLFKPREKTTQFVRKLSAGSPTQEQSQHLMSSSSDAYPAPDSSSGGDVTRLERERLVELERQLSATLAAQIERDQRAAQLTNELALKSTLIEQAEANAAEATTRAGLEHAQVVQKDAELVDMRAKLDEAQSALQKATPCAADADERSQCACEKIGKYETELAEVRVKLEAREDELEAIRLRLMDAEIGWAKSKTEADTLRAMTTAGLANTDEDQISSRLIERMRAMEAELASLSLRLGEKSLDAIQSRNEG